MLNYVTILQEEKVKLLFNMEHLRVDRFLHLLLGFALKLLIMYLKQLSLNHYYKLTDFNDCLFKLNKRNQNSTVYTLKFIFLQEQKDYK